MTTSGCPSELDLTRALQIGPDPALEAHLARCPSCRAVWEDWTEAIRLARQVPVELPSAAEREAVRRSILAAAEGAPAPDAPRRPPALAWAGALVVAASFAIWFVARKPPQPPERARASIFAIGAADYKVVAPLPTETVWLRDGTLAFDVAPLHANERFKVMTGDGEVEVRGTHFEVTATNDRLQVVRVTRGHVEVRPLNRGSVLLGPGEIWHSEAPPRLPLPHPTVAAKAPPAPSPRPERPRRRPQWAAQAEQLSGADSPDDAARRSPSPQESTYDDAWDAMRSGDFQRAATSFRHVTEVAPRGPLADEGAFWQGVALARAGERREATAAFQRMLDAYPSSPRRGEASAMVGWLLVDEDPAEAGRLFRSAVNDPRPTVRESARQGLSLLLEKGAIVR